MKYSDVRKSVMDEHTKELSDCSIYEVAKLLNDRFTHQYLTNDREETYSFPSDGTIMILAMTKYLIDRIKEDNNNE